MLRWLTTLFANDHVATLRYEREYARADLARVQRDLDEARRLLDAAIKDRDKALHTMREMSFGVEAARQKERTEYWLRLARLEGENRELSLRATTAQTNFEWARLMFNKGEAERTQLTQHILQRPLQAFSLEREDDVGVVSGLRTPDREPPPDGPDASIGAAATRLGVHFDDVGDDLAAELGISHTEDGTVQYRR